MRGTDLWCGHSTHGALLYLWWHELCLSSSFSATKQVKVNTGGMGLGLTINLNVLRLVTKSAIGVVRERCQHYEW